MSRSASVGLRPRPLSRLSTPAIILSSLTAAIALTAFGDSQAQAPQAESRDHARLTPVRDAMELRVLDWTLWNVSKYYVEPQRIDPQTMTMAGLEALEAAIAQVLVEPTANNRRVRVRVGTAEREFQVGDVEALWAVGPHIREVFRFVSQNTELTDEELRNAEYAVVAGVLGTLDPHTNLLRPDDFADMKASTKGSFGGLGIEVGMRDGAITVIRVIDGNPAAKADLRAGDRIVQIDAESTVTLGLNEAVTRLRGAPGTTVTLHVLRNGLDKPKPIKVTRATIKLDSVIGNILESKDDKGKLHKVGLVEIRRNFAQTTGKELRDKLAEFEREGVEGVILDLRDNPGGLLPAAVEVADAFLSHGTIVSTVGTSSPREENRADDRYDFPDLPVVVLVDQGSASASEIVAGALRNLGRAVLFGRRTFGKGSVQVLHERKVGEEELALKLTIAQYLTPGDVSIQSVGVSPDLETVPVYVGEEHIAYFGRERFDLLREESLASHLESNTAEMQKAAFGPLYFLSPGSAGLDEDEKPTPPEDGSPDRRNATELLKDPEIRLARDFVLWAPTSSREGLLAKMDEFVERKAVEEQQRIAKGLKTRAIDWNPGPKPTDGTAPALRVELQSDKPGNSIKGGERGTVIVSVTNDGTAPAYQVRAMTDSDHRYFDERELLFGRINPGETKTYKLPLTVPEHELSRTDRIDFHFFEQYGRKLADGAITSIDISAEGLPRPHFAYGYQIIDQGKGLKGNGDGVLQVGERVKLRVNVSNTGEGPALDTWVTMRNHAGESFFLETGRQQLKVMAPGDQRTVDLEFEVRQAADEGALQLTVSDNKIAEVLSEKVVFEVQEKGTVIEAMDGGVAMTKDTPLYASVQGERVVARVTKGSKFAATGRTANMVRVELEDGAFAFAPSDAIEELGKRVAQPPKIEPIYAVSPPLITLMGAPTQADGESVHLSGIATDEQSIRDLYITVYNPSRNLFGNAEKVFYQASTNEQTGRLEFAADVPLTPGNNLIEIHAREDEDVIGVKRMWVLRTSGLTEARAKNNPLQSNGQLRVDTFK